jgi:four helix bundle protein
MHTYSFEKLEAWQLSKKLVIRIYALTDKFPHSEKFGLVLQMRRSCISISSNLAEGSGRRSAKDQAHFYNLAYSSLMELLNQILIAGDLKWINDEDILECRKCCELISAKINALRRAILNPTNKNV